MHWELSLFPFLLSIVTIGPDEEVIQNWSCSGVIGCAVIQVQARIPAWIWSHRGQVLHWLCRCQFFACSLYWNSAGIFCFQSFPCFVGSLPEDLGLDLSVHILKFLDHVITIFEWYVCLLTDACRPQVCGEIISRSTAREANWALWIWRVCSSFWICWLEELVSEAIQSLDKLYYIILMFVAGILLFK